jgi:molybdate transport system substrate-binding protein
LTVVCFAMSLGLPPGVLGGQELLSSPGPRASRPWRRWCGAFERETGTRVSVTFGGSGYVLSQMIMARKGDLYFPGSSDFMELAKRKGVVLPETERKVVYLVPAINVQRGNPKNIKGLEDLTLPGLRVAIANPEGVCVGTYAVEIIEKWSSPAEKAAFMRNLVNYTESCEKTATAISLKAVDAVIGWSVFEHWDPARIETVPLKPSEVIRVGYLPIAVSRYSKDPGLAHRFIEFLLSEAGRALFRKYKYFMSPQEAFDWIGEEKPVGGEYSVPEEWIKR